MAEGITKAVAQRVITDMLGSIQDTAGGGWKVLVLDEFTTKILSSALKMSDIQDCNVSVVENLFVQREPMPLVGVYFLQPTPDSIAQLVQDFSGARPLYPSVHVFFSSKLPSSGLNKIKGCPGLISVIKTLKESNIEFLTVDSHTFTVDSPMAPELLMGDLADLNAREGEKELDFIAMRLSTALATFNEFPTVRYKKGKEPGPSDPPGSQSRATLAQRLATRVLERADALQQAGQLPARETCDLIVLDRGFDVVAPFIHEWTYESVVYDLLTLDGNSYKYKSELANGKTEERETALDEHDSLWCDLRHMFIADVYSTVGNRWKEFLQHNKAARMEGTSSKKTPTSRELKAVIAAMPQYREALSRLDLHIQIAAEVRAETNRSRSQDSQWSLTLAGEMEQDLILGEKNSKDMLEFLQEHQQDMSTADKVRLFICYCATHPEKLDEEKMSKWMKAARLSQHDMVTVTNIALLGCNVFPPPRQEKSSFFGGLKKRDPADALRRKKLDDNGYALNRFDPLLKDILSDLAANRLPNDQFPYVRAPGAQADANSAQSARSGRSMINWTRRGAGEGPSGRRLFVFLIGGASRGEMRVCHELSKTLGREVILGTTSVSTPKEFLDSLVRMNSANTMYGL